MHILTAGSNKRALLCTPLQPAATSGRYYAHPYSRHYYAHPYSRHYYAHPYSRQQQAGITMHIFTAGSNKRALRCTSIQPAATRGHYYAHPQLGEETRSWHRHLALNNPAAAESRRGCKFETSNNS
ncbi:hypothetical protein NDU88_000935 [Pleurodeles waltl]|uniref:Uncharacterized protein n=1 Tax=Pleurodeles waltl TaxID=8319 RepID=A0AAV7R5L2_PLEWA|nr:hypothetical protein NDU88_000935 [Pleurodeles waltl]